MNDTAALQTAGRKYHLKALTCSLWTTWMCTHGWHHAYPSVLSVCPPKWAKGICEVQYLSDPWGQYKEEEEGFAPWWIHFWILQVRTKFALKYGNNDAHDVLTLRTRHAVKSKYVEALIENTGLVCSDQQKNTKERKIFASSAQTHFVFLFLGLYTSWILVTGSRFVNQRKKWLSWMLKT